MISSMNDLPTMSGKSSNPPQSPTITVGIGKESEGVHISDTESMLKDSVKEMELPKEVEAIGVKTQPTVISIPKPLQQMGVKPIGTNIPSKPVARPVPLTDEQIAIGLHVSIMDSFRWFAEWCRKQLKHIGIAK